MRRATVRPRLRKFNVAAGDRNEAHQRLEQRALAGAIGADERHDLAFVDRDRHAVERDKFAVAHTQVAHREQAHDVLPR